MAIFLGRVVLVEVFSFWHFEFVMPLLLTFKFFAEPFSKCGPVWFGWLEHCPVDQRVMGLIPGQGAYPGQSSYEKATN